MLTSLEIPDDLPFSALKLERDADGAVSFDAQVIGRICAVNGLDPSALTEDQVSAVIVAWYRAHLEQGGERDIVQDDLIREVAAEEARGGGFSYPPGRA